MKRLFSVILITLIIFTGTLSNWQSVSAGSIQENKKKVEEIKSKKNEINEKQSKIIKEKKETNGKIDKNLSKQDKVKSEIEIVNNQLANTQSAISSKEKEIQQINDEIDKLKVEIKELEESIKKRESLLKNRLRTIQQNGGEMGYIEVVLGSQNFGDFVSRTTAVNTIMNQDKRIMDTHMNEKQQLEQKKKEVISKKETAEEQKQELESLKAKLDQQAAKKKSLMAQLEAEHANLESNKANLEEQESRLHNQESKLQEAMRAAQDEIARLQKIAAERARKEKAARERAAREEAELEQRSSDSETKPVVYTDADFIWPSRGSRTSNFGMRRDPITGRLAGHTGIDINGETGDAIRASISGYAIPVNISWTYGTHLMVVGEVNGRTYTTLYAHMSSSSIGGGKYVEQGEKIGEMGSTGRSTGSHLHFEIHQGTYSGASSAVNPINYLR
ncbi:murein hydrolase activator EnvC family protein [Virgibacillus sp. DJP39]|uniref:murein hydrolase activator EnvC family protein n=1 Tax=Virgibacillus sp. DJP39 TaxID=3409790 RepID=UPI003BB53221